MTQPTHVDGNAAAGAFADVLGFDVTTSARRSNIQTGDVMPGNYIAIWKTLSDNNIPIRAMRDTQWLVCDGQPFFPSGCMTQTHPELPAELLLQIGESGSLAPSRAPKAQQVISADRQHCGDLY